MQSLYFSSFNSSLHGSTMLVGRKNVDLEGNQECVALCDCLDSVCLHLSENRLLGRIQGQLSISEVRVMLKQLYP